MKPGDQIASIARELLGIPTLEVRRSDALDFHEVAVWSVADALHAAFQAGKQSHVPPAADLQSDQRSIVTNESRAKRISELLKMLRGDEGDHTYLVDLLADAMHWCDYSGGDFHLALAQACRHYIHELNDQQTDERRL